ncbi:MAG: chromosomal replication initiator protein DnaA [Deltaproteobacteria bacterium]|nr:chromosomal replication initiator protein DnaA [Deltaproteobacteria bacterium]
MILSEHIPEKWEKFIKNLNSELESDEVEAWVNNLTLLDFNSRSITLGGINQFFCNWIRDHHQSLLKKHLYDTFEPLNLDNDFKLILLSGNSNCHSTSSLKKTKKSKKNPDGLNPLYHFDDFINGGNSDIAYAAARSIGENIINSKYNPFFICGGVGLGKTHLVQAIGNQAKISQKNINILYANSRDFTNDVINEIRFGKIQTVRNKYRSVDLLIIDDIQFLENKETTQQEFFHIFNDLVQNKKQIVLTADRYPIEIKKLEERLVNRFNSGMVARIDPPDFETRVAIIRSKVDNLKLPLNEDVITLLANSVKNNVRDILGILLHLEAKWSLLGHKITLDMAKLIIKEVLNIEDEPKSIDNIIKKLSLKYDVKIMDIKSDKRDQKISKARQISMYVVREITGLSYPVIGKHFGGKNHTSVMQACKKTKLSMENDPEIKQTITTLIRELSV